jgi:hypothetical protein
LAERIDTQGRQLSDHPTVTVEVDLDPSDIPLAAPIVQ